MFQVITGKTAHASGPQCGTVWHPDRKTAQFWAGYLAQFYPDACVQSMAEVYPKNGWANSPEFSPKKKLPGAGKPRTATHEP